MTETESNSPIDRAIAALGSAAALAKELSVSAAAVSQWKSGERLVPEERASAIEFATEGKVCVEDLTPASPWLRIADKKWPHPKGRPVIDHAARNRVAGAAAKAGA